jgi:PadR family transcriptional regulator, regulatory protein AphA
VTAAALGRPQRGEREAGGGLKQGVAATVGNFWTVPHSQLYRECDRLAGAGLLEVEQEVESRRRKRYALSAIAHERVWIDFWEALARG